MTGGLLVAGTTSDAGKSLLTAGICRWLVRRGVRVAPFKAQNMSNNSAVVVDEYGHGGEIGRAQAMQAAAARITPSVRLNPVLLKPGSDRTSQVVLLGRAVGRVDAVDYRTMRRQLRQTVLDTLAGLRAEYDVVVCEGAGSPTEINLRDGDFTNMGLARAAGLPTIVVGDIDRGGVFASLYGTLALLSAEDQALLAGFVVNKFRGDARLLQPGLDALHRLTGRPFLGVLPWQPDLWIDGEDSLAYGRVVGRSRPPLGTEWLRVAVVRLPRISNVTDAEALAAEPGVQVRLTTEPSDLADADLVVLPGSKSTVDDLTWLRETALADAVTAHARAGRPLLGICGGYQMLAERIHDEVESRQGTVAGLGLLPTSIRFAADKTVGRPAGTGSAPPCPGTRSITGTCRPARPSRSSDTPTEPARAPGSATSSVPTGTAPSSRTRSGARSWRRSPESAGRHGFKAAPDTDFAGLRERGLDILGDLVEEHLDTAALWRLIEQGAPAGLPFVPPGAP